MAFQRTNRRVAVKVYYADRMDRLRNRHAENPEQEIAALQLLGQDPVHVVGVEEVLNDGQNLNMVMPFCDHEDLCELLHPREGDQRLLTEDQARVWTRQIMKGVSFLHSRGICHRDLSPENVMIDGEEMFIIDMGMCLRVPYVDPMNSGARTDVHRANGMPRCLFKPQGPCGKLPYMSPEIYSSQGPFDGAAVDVWTSGVILFCMIAGASYRTPHMLDPSIPHYDSGTAPIVGVLEHCLVRRWSRSAGRHAAGRSTTATDPGGSLRTCMVRWTMKHLLIFQRDDGWIFNVSTQLILFFLLY